ncbi:MAG: M23 family metallopeptidase [Bacteroidales bacterium]
MIHIQRYISRTQITALILFLALTAPISAQRISRLPLDTAPILSGNFGELRPHHFHSGIDFKTEGVVGKPIYSVDSGYVARINISPYGYGKVIYINHPSGLTSVYAHLDGFSHPLDSIVEEYQYRLESFAVNILFREGEVPINSGQLIALSGNSGSSAGPHLHFELRDTRSNIALNPQRYLPIEIPDTRKPIINAVLIAPLNKSSVVNNKNEHSIVRVSQAGKLISKSTPNAWGAIVAGIKATDYMNNTHNRFGVERVKLSVDDSLHFESIVNEIPLNDSRSFNSHIYYPEWKESRQFFMRSHREKGNRLNLYTTYESDGVIHIDEERPYKIRYQLFDYAGNSSSIQFTIQGVKPKEEIVDSTDVLLFPHNRESRFENEEFTLFIAAGGLYDDIHFEYLKRSIDSLYSSVHSIHTPYIALHSGAEIGIRVTNDTIENKQRYFVGELVGKRIRAIGGRYENGWMRANVSEFGEYVVDIDTVAPEITSVGALRFRIKDRKSGIKTYKGTLDGEFILMEYDAKRNALDAKPSRKRVGTKKERLFKLIVEDNCGNTAIYQRKVVI